MANINFTTWLGNSATSGQQAQYNALTGGFQAGGFVKAEDFNAALRMTTLICAGIADGFSFATNLGVDSSEDAIAAAIKAPTFASLKTTGTITAGGVLTGASLKIGNTERISSTGKVTASDVDVGNSINASTIHAVSEVSGGEISSEGDVTASGTVYADSLNIAAGAAQISSAGDFTGRDIDVKAVKVTSITNTGLYSGKNITGTTLTVTNVYGTGGTAPVFQNGATFNDTVKLPSKGTTLQGSYGSGWIAITSGATEFNTALVLSDSTYSDVATKKSIILIRVALWNKDTNNAVTGIYYGLFPNSSQEVALAYSVTGDASVRMTIATDMTTGAGSTPRVTIKLKSSASLSYSHVAIETIRLFDTPFSDITKPV